MMYKEKYKAVALQQKIKEREKMQEIAELNNELKDVEEELTRSKMNVENFYDRLKRGGRVSSSFLGVQSDPLMNLKREKKMNAIQQLILDKNKELYKIQKKLEKINALEEDREKTFYEEIRKKEEKMVEGIKGVMKHKGR